jgi:hypothetical protein
MMPHETITTSLPDFKRTGRKFLARSQAAAMRLNQAMSSTSQQISGGLTTALTDVTMGTKTASQAFQSFGLMAVRAIEQMIIQLTIVGPLMRGLQGGLQGGVGGVLGLLTGSYKTAADAGIGSGVGSGGFNFIDAGVAHSGGMVENLSMSRAVDPAYFENAPLFDVGEKISGDAPSQ